MSIDNDIKSIITVIPYVDNIYCQAILGTPVTHRQEKLTYGHEREININHNRHEAQQLVRNHYSNASLVLLMDSDVIATDEQLNALLNAFDGSPIALRTKLFDTEEHICCACCLLKMPDYMSIKYVDEYVDECQCRKIMRLFGVRYLDGYQAYEYNERTRLSNMLHHEKVEKYILQPTADIHPVDPSRLGTRVAK